MPFRPIGRGPIEPIGPSPIGDPGLRSSLPLVGRIPYGEPRGILGTMHKGGKIKKSGIYNMQKGEKVIPAKKAKKKMARMTGLLAKY